MVLPGSKSPAKVQWGFPRNLGDPVVSVEDHLGTGWPNLNKPRPAGRAFASRRERNGERIDGTAKRRKTKRGGTGGGKSQRPDSTEGGGEASPVKRGNPATPGDRVEGSGASDHAASGRNDVGCIDIRTRLTETSEDSATSASMHDLRNRML